MTWAGEAHKRKKARPIYRALLAFTQSSLSLSHSLRCFSMASMAARAATTAAAAVRAVARAAPASAGRELHVQTQPPVQQQQYPWKEKLERFKGELSKGVWGYWHLGAWKPLALSARKRARLRKEVLLAGE